MGFNSQQYRYRKNSNTYNRHDTRSSFQEPSYSAQVVWLNSYYWWEWLCTSTDMHIFRCVFSSTTSFFFVVPNDQLSMPKTHRIHLINSRKWSLIGNPFWWKSLVVTLMDLVGSHATQPALSSWAKYNLVSVPSVPSFTISAAGLADNRFCYLLDAPAL